MGMSDEQKFERWANKQSAKGRDIRVTLMKQGDLAQFRSQYGVDKKISKVHCPYCGYKQLYESLVAECLYKGYTYAVCRECKAEVSFSILKEGSLPEEKMLIHAEGSPEDDPGPDEVIIE